jgi:hypothetical protein
VAWRQQPIGQQKQSTDKAVKNAPDRLRVWPISARHAAKAQSQNDPLGG